MYRYRRKNLRTDENEESPDKTLETYENKTIKEKLDFENDVEIDCSH